MSDTLQLLLQELDSKQAQIALHEQYYTGNQPLSYLSPEAKVALGTRFGRLSSNLPRLAVTSLAERLRVVGFTVGGTPAPELWQTWLRSDMDQLGGVAHREALALGRSYAIVWADRTGKARITVESARQVAALTDPGSRQIVAAVKRWESVTPAGLPDKAYAVLYLPDRIERYVSESTAAAAYKLQDTIDNPLGVVPVVQLRNTDRLLDDGTSEMADLIPLVDALNKTLADMLVGSEYYARPRRWATGIELVEDEHGHVENPFPEGDRMLISEAPESKFGQLADADLASYEAAVRVLTSQIMAVSALPAHYIGSLTAQPASADALRASEASLTARAEARQHVFGRAWEQAGRIALAVDTQRHPDEFDVRVQWADPSTRSLAQEADAVVKLFTAGLLPASAALARLGYSDDEIAAIRSARRAEALDGQAVDLGKLIA
ncbi:phage portal protein [Rhodococcus pyridinivorans]|uniref:phage portal protein n=1 Tax=Rhodococcus pyridinivorans TaxID=103816 RepID=UPI0020C72D4E|nr:phage portal protein [Rhodococcus pyridinivorans]UTM38320.1 phage portal protein [Rhodococcus pyridinivorans]